MSDYEPFRKRQKQTEPPSVSQPEDEDEEESFDSRRTEDVNEQNQRDLFKAFPASAKLQKKKKPVRLLTLDQWVVKKPSITQINSDPEPVSNKTQTTLDEKSPSPSEPDSVGSPGGAGSVPLADREYSDVKRKTKTDALHHTRLQKNSKGAVGGVSSRALGLAGKQAVSSDVTCMGVPVSELQRAPACSSSLPPLKPTDRHTVMIRTDLLCPGSVPVPYPSPDEQYDRWDSSHVKMPFSNENMFPGDNMSVQSRWGLIQKALRSTFCSSHDVQAAILKYNTGQAKGWDFTALHIYCEDLHEFEVQQIFGDIALLALKAPSLCTQPVPLLRSQTCRSITLSQQQVSCLLANAFFCTFPRRNSRKTEFSSYPDINFSRLFEGSSRRKQEKLKTLMCYFRRVSQHRPTGLLTFTRQCVTRFPSWSRSEKTFTKLHITCHGTIEDQCGLLQVDFANSFVGGGVLGSGLVQEEIRFLINPELITARLFTERLEDNECLIITGSEQFSRYSGYSDTYRWDGDYDDHTPRDVWERRCTEIVAMDALQFRNFQQQFNPENMTRELNKAYCGFYRPDVGAQNLSAVATGNWGCGVFGGDARLKALLQLMAAAEAERDLMYFTFGDSALMRDVYDIHTRITQKHASVGAVYDLLQQYYDCVCKGAYGPKPQESLYTFLTHHL